MERALKKDDQQIRGVLRALGKYEVVRSDLVPLLCSYANEEKILISVCKIVLVITPYKSKKMIVLVLPVKYVIIYEKYGTLIRKVGVLSVFIKYI